MTSYVYDSQRSVIYVASTVILIALSLLYPGWRRHAKIQALKRQHGCKDPPRYPHQGGSQGSDLAHIRMNAMKEGRLFKLYETQFELYGKTFEEIFNGQKLVNTIEPANIQQITALAFDDYCKNPGRLKAQAPFLGPSVFSDGPLWKQTRPLVKSAFGRAEISDLDQLASFTDRFMALIPNDGSTIDMQPLLHRLVSDALTSLGADHGTETC